MVCALYIVNYVERRNDKMKMRMTAQALILSLILVAVTFTTTHAQVGASDPHLPQNQNPNTRAIYGLPRVVPTTQDTPAWYEVISRDNPWKLFGPKWTVLRDLNEWLVTDDRIDYRDANNVWVRIHPKERLLLNNELKAILEARGVRLVQTTPPPIPAKAESKPAATGPVTGTQTQTASNDSTSLTIFGMSWWIAVLLLLLLVATAYEGYKMVVARNTRKREQIEQERQEAELLQAHEARERELTRDPVRSGPPYVPGGIQPNEPERIRDFFREQAIAAYAERNPSIDRNTITVTQIGPVERGWIHGEGLVGYLGRGFEPRRIEAPGIQAYQARYRFADGTEQFLQCLQGCMNPVRFGGEVYQGFTFTADAVVVAPPAPAAATPQPVPHPTMAARSIRTAAEEDGRSTVTLGDKVFTFDRGAHFVLNETTGTITLAGNSFEVTFIPKALQAKPVLEIPPRTGTDNA